MPQRAVLQFLTTWLFYLQHDLISELGYFVGLEQNLRISTERIPATLAHGWPWAEVLTHQPALELPEGWDSTISLWVSELKVQAGRAGYTFLHFPLWFWPVVLRPHVQEAKRLFTQICHQKVSVAQPRGSHYHQQAFSLLFCDHWVYWGLSCCLSAS